MRISYFGGKAPVASVVWNALGQTQHYIEPFFGSGAVLLARPYYDPTQHVETVNDKDGLLCNVWRALQTAPDEVAKWCDWLVNHADLCARRIVLLREQNALLQQLIASDEYYNAKLAGYWIWAASCWIGAGLTRVNAIPHLGCAGMGVHKIGKIPHLADAGVGVHKIGTRPQQDTERRAVTDPYNTLIYDWFRALSERLRNVRVVCGDWTQVCGGDWQDKVKGDEVGIFFDPPYSVEDREDVYSHDSKSIATDVREWCRARAERPSYRIVLAGYYEEHESLLNEGWRVHLWKTRGGYGNTARNGGDSRGKRNRFREALFFSPHCIQTGLGL